MQKIQISKTKQITNKSGKKNSSIIWNFYSELTL